MDADGSPWLATRAHRQMVKRAGESEGITYPKALYILRKLSWKSVRVNAAGPYGMGDVVLPSRTYKGGRGPGMRPDAAMTIPAIFEGRRSAQPKDCTVVLIIRRNLHVVKAITGRRETREDRQAIVSALLKFIKCQPESASGQNRTSGREVVRLPKVNNTRYSLARHHFYWNIISSLELGMELRAIGWQAFGHSACNLQVRWQERIIGQVVMWIKLLDSVYFSSTSSRWRSEISTCLLRGEYIHVCIDKSSCSGSSPASPSIHKGSFFPYFNL